MATPKIPRFAYVYRSDDLGPFTVYDHDGRAMLTDGTKTVAITAPAAELQAYIDGLTEEACAALVAGASGSSLPAPLSSEEPAKPTGSGRRGTRTAVPDLPQGTEAAAPKRKQAFSLDVADALPPEYLAQIKAKQLQAPGEKGDKLDPILFKASWCISGGFDPETFVSGGGFSGQIKTYIVRGSASYVTTWIWNKETGRIEQHGKTEQVASIPLYPEKLVRVNPGLDPPKTETQKSRVNFKVRWVIPARADGSKSTVLMPHALAGMGRDTIRDMAESKEFPNDPRSAAVLAELTTNAPGVRIPTLKDPNFPSEAFDGRCEPLPVEDCWSAFGWARNPDPNDPLGVPTHVWSGSPVFAPKDGEAAPPIYVDQSGEYSQQRAALAALIRLSVNKLALVPLGVAAGSFLLGLPYTQGADPANPRQGAAARYLPSIGGFFHFLGDPGKGKSTTGKMACSMVGMPEPMAGGNSVSLFTAADASKAGVELMASQLNHGFFVLDEVQNLMTGSRVDDLAAHLMALVNGGNRVVAGRNNGLRASRASLALLMTTGNVGWISMVNQGRRAASNQAFIQALMSRGIEWDVRRHPIFPEHPAGSDERAEIARQIDAGMETLQANYGHIYPVLIKAFAQNRNKIMGPDGLLRRRADAYRRNTHPAISRLASMLASTEIAMEALGRILGLTPAEVKEAQEAFEETLKAIETEMQEVRDEEIPPHEAFLSWVFSQEGRLFVQGHMPGDGGLAAAQQKQLAVAHNASLRDARTATLGVIRQREPLGTDGVWNDEVVLNITVRDEYDRIKGTGAFDAVLVELRRMGWLRMAIKNGKVDSEAREAGKINESGVQLFKGRGYIISLGRWSDIQTGRDQPQPLTPDEQAAEEERRAAGVSVPWDAEEKVIVGEDASGFPIYGIAGTVPTLADIQALEAETGISVPDEPQEAGGLQSDPPAPLPAYANGGDRSEFVAGVQKLQRRPTSAQGKRGAS